MRGKKDIHWSSPKYHQTGWNKFITTVRGLKKHPCKRLKGEHQYELFEKRTSGWTLDTDKVMIFEEFRCIGCGKKKVTYIIRSEGDK